MSREFFANIQARPTPDLYAHYTSAMVNQQSLFLTANQSFSTTSGVDVPGFSFTLAANKSYWFQYNLAGSCLNPDGYGIQFAGTVVPSQFKHCSSSFRGQGVINSNSTTAIGNVLTGADLINNLFGYGMLTTGALALPTFKMQARVASGSGPFVIQAGSVFIITELG